MDLGMVGAERSGMDSYEKRLYDFVYGGVLIVQFTCGYSNLFSTFCIAICSENAGILVKSEVSHEQLAINHIVPIPLRY